MALHAGKADTIRRSDPPPVAGDIHIPLLRSSLGGVDFISRCSAPIYVTESDTNEHFAKRLAVEHSDLLAPDERKKVAVGNQSYKSYRLPLRTRLVGKVVWFVGGSKRCNLMSLCKQIKYLGKKRSYGYARVCGWNIDEVEEDLSWFAKTEKGTLLMRVLPFCDNLPSDLIGFRRGFGGVVPPLWHPGRFVDAVYPV